MAAEIELTDNEDVRRRALSRLAIAGVVTAAALAGLWWLDQGGGHKTAQPAPTLPAPILTAPPRPSEAPQSPLVEEGATVPAVDEKLEAPAAPMSTELPSTPIPHAGGSAVTEAPPPPKVSNAPKALPPVTTPTTHSSPPSLAAQVPTSASGEHFVVQLGVFSSPRHAFELIEKLKRQGVTAHMETRVQLGPFANREEAERAQERMRKLGLQGLVTPATK
jgi:DedD protein